MNTQDLMGRMDAVITELEDLRAQDTLTEDQNSRADQLMAELNDLGPKIQRSQAADAAIEAHKSNSQSRGSVANVQPKGEVRTQPEARKSIGDTVVESDEYKQFIASGGARGQFSVDVESRALVHTGTLPADYLEPMRIPGIMRGTDTFGSLRDVITVGQTDSDALIYFRETAFTNNAAAVGESSAMDATSGLKPESALTFNQVVDGVATIAHWIPITKQTLWNAPELRSYIEGRLIDGLNLEENDQLLNGNGTGDNLTGLLNVTGVQALDAAYFTANAVNDTGTDNENFNRVLRGRTMVSTVGRAQANFVVLNPVDHETFMASTDAQQQYFGAGPFAAGNVPTLWGMRAVVNENITAGSVLVGDGRQAMILDRMQATITAGWADKDFIQNRLRLLAEKRVGLAVFRPQAFAVVELAA